MEQSDRAKNPQSWQPRKSESKQKAINITGSIIVGLTLLAIGGAIKMINDLKATVNKADINTKAIEKTSRVTHNRITKNHEKLEEVCEMAIRADERSVLNNRRIDIMEIRVK